MIMEVVAADVNHDGMALQLINALDLRSKNRRHCRAVSRNIEARKIALMAVVVPGERVNDLLFRIPVTARLHREAGIGRAAVRILMHVEAVHAGSEAFEVRVESNAVGGIHRNHLADGRVAVLAEEVDIDDDLFLGRHRIVQLRLIGVGVGEAGRGSSRTEGENFERVLHEHFLSGVRRAALK